MGILGRSYRIPGVVGMNHSIYMLCSRNFSLEANQKRTDLLAKDKTSFIVKTLVQAIVCFLGAVLMSLVPFDKIL